MLIEASACGLGRAVRVEASELLFLRRLGGLKMGVRPTRPTTSLARRQPNFSSWAAGSLRTRFAPKSGSKCKGKVVENRRLQRGFERLAWFEMRVFRARSQVGARSGTAHRRWRAER